MKIDIWNFAEIEKETRAQLEAIRARDKTANLGLQCRYVIRLSTINSLKYIYSHDYRILNEGKEISLYDNRHDFPGMIFLHAVKAGIISPQKAIEAISSDPNKELVYVKLAQLHKADGRLLGMIFASVLETWSPPEDVYKRVKRLELILSELWDERHGFPNSLRQKILDKVLSFMDQGKLTIEELKLVAHYTKGSVRDKAIGVIRAKTSSSAPIGARKTFKVWSRSSGWSAVSIFKKEEANKGSSENIPLYVEAICALYDLADEDQKQDVLDEVVSSVVHINDLRRRFGILKHIREIPEELVQQSVLEYIEKGANPTTMPGNVDVDFVQPLLHVLASHQVSMLLERLDVETELGYKLLLALAPYLDDQQRLIADQKMSTQNDFKVTQYWVASACNLSKNRIVEIFWKVMDISRDFTRQNAIVGLAPFLPSDQLDQAVDALVSFKDPGDKYHLISGIIEFLNPEQIEQVIEVAETLPVVVYDDWYGYSSAIFAVIAKHVSEDRKQKFLRKAIDDTFIYNVEERRNKFEPLIALAEGENIDRLLFQISRLSDHLCHRSEMLNLLAPRLNREQLVKAIDIINWCEDGANLALLLSELAQYMSDADKNAILHDAVTLAIHEEFGEYRESAIKALIPFLDEKETLYAIKYCERYIYRDTRSGILSDLHDNFFSESEEGIRASIENIVSFPERVKFIAKICDKTFPSIPTAVFEYLPEDPREFEECFHQPAGLLSLAPYLNSDLREEIINVLLPHVLELANPFDFIIMLAPFLSQVQSAKILNDVRDKSGHKKEEAMSMLSIKQEPYEKRADIIEAELEEYRREELISNKLREDGFDKNKTEISAIYERNVIRLRLFKTLKVEDAIEVSQRNEFLSAIFYSFQSTKERRLIADALLDGAENADPASFAYHTLLYLVPHMSDDQKKKALPVAMTSPDISRRLELFEALGLELPKDINALSDEIFEREFQSDKTLKPIRYRVSKLKPLLQLYNGKSKLENVSDLIENLSNTCRSEAVGTISALVPTIFEQEGIAAINEILEGFREVVDVPDYEAFLN